MSHDENVKHAVSDKHDMQYVLIVILFLEKGEEVKSVDDGDTTKIESFHEDTATVDLEDLTNETKAKISKILCNSILSSVKCLSEENIDQYCNIVESYFPLNLTDWEELRKEINEAVINGPKLHIKVECGKLERKLETLRNPEKLKIVAFIHAASDNKPISKVIEGRIISTENNIEFDLEDSLSLPSFRNSILSVEIRKIKNEEKVGFKEIPVDNIQPNMEVDLRKPDVQTLSISFKSLENVGQLQLRFRKDTNEDFPSKTVPKLMSKYLIKVGAEVFTIDEESVTPSDDNISHKLAIHQRKISESNLKYKPYKKFVKVDQDKCDSDYSNAAVYDIDCIVSNKIEFGVEKNKNLLGVSDSRSPSVSPSISPASSRLSLVDFGLVGGFLDKLSLGSSSSEVPKSERRKSFLGLDFDKFTQPQPPSSEKKRKLPVDRYLETLLEKNNVKEMVGKSDCSWNVGMSVNTEVNFTAEELRQIYLHSIAHATSIIDKSQSWDGNLPITLKAILSILIMFSDSDKKETDAIISQAFVESFCRIKFHDSILTKHISKANIECLQPYIESCLQFLATYKFEATDMDPEDRIVAVVGNLKILLDHEIVCSASIEECIQKSFRGYFQSKIKNEGSIVNQMERCRVVLIRTFKELRKSNQVYQNIFDGVIDFKRAREDMFLKLSKDLLNESLPKEILKPQPIGYMTVAQDVRRDNLQAALDVFIIVKTILKQLYPMQPLPLWLFEFFEGYPECWIEHLALFKAKVFIDNLVKYLESAGMKDQINGNKQEEAKNEDDTEKLREKQKSLSRNNSNEESYLIQTLYNYTVINSGCWKSREELEWPDNLMQVKTELILIKSLASLEKVLLSQFEKIHYQDDEYDAKELCDTIKILDGLLRNWEGIEKQMKKDEEKEECLNIKFEESKLALENIKSELSAEIIEKIKQYCQERRVKIKSYIDQKQLIDIEDEQADTLIKFIDEECTQLAQLAEHQNQVIIQLWKMVEEELMMRLVQKMNDWNRKDPSKLIDQYKILLPELKNMKQKGFEILEIPELKLELLDKSKPIYF